MSDRKKQDNKIFFHYAVVVFFIFGFGYIPPPTPLTPVGMKVLGVFLGVVYGWTFTERFVPALMGMISLSLLESQTPQSILMMGLGRELVWFLLLMFVFMNIMDEVGITEYASNWVMTRKILNGRPWLLSFFFILAAVLIGTINLMSSMLFLWAILYRVCDRTGYERYSPYAASMLVGIALFAVWGFVAMPFQSQALLLTSAFADISGISISFGSFLMFSIPTVIVGMLIFIIVMRFVMRVDVSRLKDIDMSRSIGKLPPLDRKQKHVFAA